MPGFDCSRGCLVLQRRGRGPMPLGLGRREGLCSALFSTLLCPRRLTNPQRLHHPGSLAASSRGWQWEALAESRGRGERKAGGFSPSPACPRAAPLALTICDCSSGSVAPVTVPLGAPSPLSLRESATRPREPHHSGFLPSTLPSPLETHPSLRSCYWNHLE